MEEEALARLTVAVAIGMGITIFLIFYWSPLSRLAQRIQPDPEKRFKLIAIILIMSLAVVGGAVSIIKMFHLIDAFTQG